MQSNARSFTFIDGQTTRFWSVSRNSNQLIISQGLSGSPHSEIAQDFESEESAKLAMLELISEKVDAGYIEDKLTIDLSIRQNSQRLPVPEHTMAQPTHLIRAKTFTVEKDNSWEGPWKITVAWLDNTSEGSQQIVVKLFGRRRISIESEDLGFSPFKFVSSYASPAEIQKAFSKITDLSSLNTHLSLSNEVYLIKKKTKASRAVSSEVQLKIATLVTSESIKKVEIEEFDFDGISSEDFNKVAAATHEYLKTKAISRHVDDFNKLQRKFTISAICKLADMVSTGSIEDSWERARGFDGNIDFTKVSAESALLYAFASTGNHEYGYWVYVKQIVKALEKSGKHLQVLGMLYASFDSHAAHNWPSPRSLGDSVSEWEIFGTGRPSIATYRYMQRRARRHLDDLFQTNIEAHALLMMIILSYTSYSNFYYNLDDKAWIFAHLVYRHSWKDGNHGRKIYLPENQELENNLYVGPEITSGLSAHRDWLLRIFSKSDCLPVVVFSFQLLSMTDGNVEIKKNGYRLEFLLKSKNLELLAAVADIFDKDLNLLVACFKYNTQYLVEYSGRSDETLIKLLDILMTRDEQWSQDVVKEILGNLSGSKLRETLLKIAKHPKWSIDHLSAKSVIALLMSNYDETMLILGEEILTTVKGQNLSIWIDALKSRRVEAVSNEQLAAVIPLMRRELGTKLVLENGLYAESTSPGLKILINEISEQKRFGNLTRLLIAYSNVLTSSDAAMHVGVVVSSLIKSESDLISALKWSDEFGARGVFLDLAKVEFSTVPWQGAIKKRVSDFLISETFFADAIVNNLSIDYVASLALSLEASGFFENVFKVDAHRIRVISSLSDELLRSDDPILVTFIEGCYEDLLKIGKSNLQVLFDLSASQSLVIQATGLRAITELKLEPKTWIRLLESQLPLATLYAKQYVSTLSGTDFDNAVLVCLDSTVASAREVGLSLLEENSSRIDMETLYVKLAETTDPHLAALVAARALEPGISDSKAIDNFDRRVLKTIRQSRRAKELVKARRLNDIIAGDRVSQEIEFLISDLAMYGNVQDSDWAIEMKSFISSASTSAGALNLSGKDN
jgi:predicted DNA-binding WGR domain protein